MTANKFNLIDEKWIPIADRGLASLLDIFTDPSISSLGGDPVQKISILKLLLAIAQSAWTPATEEEWRSVGFHGMGKRVLKYLDKWHEAFWLYGEKPFLQMPAIEKAEKKSFGCVMPRIAYGNTTVLTEIHVEHEITDPEKAQILIQQMGFALSGKKVDNKIVLSPGYVGKQNEKGNPSSGRTGPSVAFQGLLHSFIFGKSLIETIWFNLFTQEDLKGLNIFPKGLGIAPWERMPQGEDDAIARDLRDSLIGRLVPLSRFILFKDDGLHYSEGIAHRNYLENLVDPSVAVDFSSKKPRVIWADVEKRPWRQLTALLSFMGQSKNNFTCMQLSVAMKRLKGVSSFSVWSGGMRVSSNAGEQYLSGMDDFVESEIQLSSAIFDNQSGFIERLNDAMENMDKLSSFLWGRVNSYFRDLKVEGGNIAGQATSMYWQLCEGSFQSLVNACAEDRSGEKVEAFKNIFLSNAYSAYDRYCPNYTARQMEAWARNRLKYVENEEKWQKEVAK